MAARYQTGRLLSEYYFCRDARPPARPPGGAATGPLPANRDDAALYRLLVLSVADYAIFAAAIPTAMSSRGTRVRGVSRGMSRMRSSARISESSHPLGDIEQDKPARELGQARVDGRFEE